MFVMKLKWEIGAMKRMTCLFLALVLLLSGCGAAEPAVTPGAEALLEFTDDLGRTVSVAEKPERVAALIGSFADIWCLAGGKDALVAAADDSWTSFDLGLGEDVVNLGAIKEPSLEALIAAEPDLILASCNTAANLELQDTFEAAGMCVAYFDVQTLDDYLNMLGICTPLTGCEENYAEYGEVVRAQADAAIARGLRIAPGEPYILIRRLRLADGVPMAIENTALNASLCRGVLDTDLKNHSLYAALTSRGLALKTGEQYMEAALADAAQAKLLDIPEGAPVLLIERHVTNPEGVTVEVTYSAYRGDSYRFYIEFDGVNRANTVSTSPKGISDNII